MRLSLNQWQSDLKDCAIPALSIRSAAGEPVVTCTPVSDGPSRRREFFAAAPDSRTSLPSARNQYPRGSLCKRNSSSRWAASAYWGGLAPMVQFAEEAIE